MGQGFRELLFQGTEFQFASFRVLQTTVQWFHNNVNELNDTET